MFVATGDRQKVLSSDNSHENLNLTFIEPPEKTKMFGPLGDAAKVFEQNSITYNSHGSMILLKTFINNDGLRNFWKPISLSTDHLGLTFVSAMEALNYPFFGVQFHPEKNQFSFWNGAPFLHSDMSIAYDRYFADFFVSQARINRNNYGDYETVQKDIIENYISIPTNTYDGNVYAFK